MKSINFIIIIFTFLIFGSCQKDDFDKDDLVYKKDIISGYIQKGPFINGTSIMISELNSTLGPTGRVFVSQITDNNGSFEIRNISLNSNYVELIANGYYFNENTGDVSASQLTLHALSDLADSSLINVNILTELEKDRVKQLVSQGKDFVSSKIQAQNEVLKIFNYSKTDLRLSEYLDISKNGEDNAILLAISIIMQGFRNEAELTELIAALSTDIKEDGVLNNQVLGQQLINDISRINISDVRNNIVNRYSDLSKMIAIPDFEQYIHQFIDNTDFIATSGIVYPEEGKYGTNVLSLNGGDFTKSGDRKFSISAEMAKGTSLKIIIYPDYLSDTTIVNEPENINKPENEFVPAHFSDYGVALADNSGWWYKNDNYSENHSMILFNTASGRTIDCEIQTSRFGSALIEIYENNQNIPTRTKRIKW